MKKSIAQSKQDFIPKAAMPRDWWVILASIHKMTEQRWQANCKNICKLTMGVNVNSRTLERMIRHGLLVKDKNQRVIFGLTDAAYEFLGEYDLLVTCEQDAQALGFYRRKPRINARTHGVAA